MNHYTHEKAFAYLVGFKWHPKHDVRIAGYQFTDISEPILFGQRLGNVELWLELIDHEPHYKAKEAILEIIDRRLALIQSKTPRAADKCFLENLMRVAHRQSDVQLVTKTVLLGLDVMSAGGWPDPAFIDWAANRSAHWFQDAKIAIEKLPFDHLKYPEIDTLMGYLDIAKKITPLIKAHSQLLSPACVDMYGSMCALSVSSAVIGYNILEQPHEISRRKRHEKFKLALNHQVSQSHLQGALGLDVIDILLSRPIPLPFTSPYKVQDLFSDQLFFVLTQATRSSIGSTNNTHLPPLINRLRQHVNCSRPHLLPPQSKLGNTSGTTPS